MSACELKLSTFATLRQELPLIFGTRLYVVDMASSLDDVGDVIADVALLLHFVQASQPY